MMKLEKIPNNLLTGEELILLHLPQKVSSYLYYIGLLFFSLTLVSSSQGLFYIELKKVRMQGPDDLELG